MRNVSDKNCRETQNTHFMFSNLRIYENCAVHETMWKNMAQLDRPQRTIQYGARASHAGYPRLQTHIQNM
jgi:hypothetical protein